MQEDLGIDPVGWGWVTAMFTLSYALFEIPTGTMGDRLGPRRVLTRIVLWWSVFTSLTGMVSNFYVLLATRFAFGAGEAGAFPNASIVVSRWFPASQRASISGVLLMSGQIGGAIAPLLVVPIQIRYGWRAAFLVFGAVGLAWAVAWHLWYRDSPSEVPGLSADERRELASAQPAPAHGFPWRVALQSGTIRSLLGIAFCYIYVYTFFQTWFHTFLVKGRGVGESGLLLSAMPYVIAVFANLAGGAASDRLVQRLGTRLGRRAIGAAALGFAGALTLAAMVTSDPLMTIVTLSLAYGGITFQQSGVFGVCLDLGGRHAGAIVGLMNTAAQVGGFVSSIAYGYIADRYGYDAPFVPMAAALLVGSLLWTRIDASAVIADQPVA